MIFVYFLIKKQRLFFRCFCILEIKIIKRISSFENFFVSFFYIIINCFFVKMFAWNIFVRSFSFVKHWVFEPLCNLSFDRWLTIDFYNLGIIRKLAKFVRFDKWTSNNLSSNGFVSVLFFFVRFVF